MTKYNNIQNNFANGMISPKLRGRTEIPEYKNGLDLCENFLGYKQGGLYRRPGSRFVMNMNDEDLSGPIIPTANPSVFLMKQTSDGYPVEVAYDPSDNSFIKYVGNASVGFLLGEEYDGSFITLNDIIDSITVGSITFLTRRDKVPLVYYVARGYSGSVFRTTSVIQLATLPIDFTRVTPLDPDSSFPKEETLNHVYSDPNVDGAFTINPSGTSGSINLVTSKKLTQVSAIGKVVKVVHGSTTGVARITGNDTTPVSANGTYPARVLVNFGSATASDNWQLSITERLKYISFYQQRVIYGYGNFITGTRTANPQTLMVNKLVQDASSDSSGLNYFGSLASTDAFRFEIASRKKGDITWIDGGEVLEIGTESGEFVAFGTNGALSSLDVNINQQTAFGTKDVPPIRSNKSLLAVSPSGYAVREFSRSGNTTTYQTRDLNILSEDIIFNGEYDALELQNESNVIWAQVSGKLITCTYHADVNIICWAIHDISGTVKYIQVINNLLFIIVDRDNGSPYEALEVINLEPRVDSLFPVKDIENKPAYLDSWIFKDFVSATNTVTGLDHLDGVECKVLIDGVTIETHTPSGGSITTTQSGTEFFIGIPYSSKIRSLPLEAGGGFGSGIGSIQRIHEIFGIFYRTIGGKAGTDRNLFSLNILDAANPENVVSEQVEKKIDHSPNKKNQIVIEQSEPLPMNILGIVYKGVTYD
jgi:hypothetical protein